MDQNYVMMNSPYTFGDVTESDICVGRSVL